MALALKIGLGAGILGTAGAAGVWNYGAAVRAGQDEDIQRWLTRTIQTHRVGALGQGDRSYLTPAATSASGMTLALHYASRQGVMRRQAQGAYVRTSIPGLTPGIQSAFEMMGM